MGYKDSDGRPCLTRATKVFKVDLMGDDVDCGTSILQKDLRGKSERGFTNRGCSSCEASEYVSRDQQLIREGTHNSPCAVFKDGAHGFCRNFRCAAPRASFMYWRPARPWKYAATAGPGRWCGGAWPIICSADTIEPRVAMNHLLGCHGPPELWIVDGVVVVSSAHHLSQWGEVG